jgi:LmbE family N-acetylglucosaminyl deacetylase
MLRRTVIKTLSIINVSLLTAAAFFTSRILAEIKPLLGESVLILVPHPDDETLGCGAVLRKHAENNGKITLVNMTDGSGAMTAMDREALKKMRKEELNQICTRLKITDVIHLDFPDGNLEVSKASIDGLAEIIKEKSPDIIYVPFFCDFHKDHVAANQILGSALKETHHYCQIRAYEIQVPITPLLFNSYLEISDDLAYKKELIQQYRSQMLSLDNVILSWKINAAFIKKARNAEVFFQINAKTYSSLVEDFVRDQEEWVKQFYASGNSGKILLTYLKGWRIRRKIRAQVLRTVNSLSLFEPAPSEQ